MHTTIGRQADRQAAFRAALVVLPVVPLALKAVVIPPDLTLPWVVASLLGGVGVGVVASGVVATVEAALGRPLLGLADRSRLVQAAVVVAAIGVVLALLGLAIAVALRTSPAVVDGMVLAGVGVGVGLALAVLGRSVVWPRLATPG